MLGTGTCSSSARAGRRDIILSASNRALARAVAPPALVDDEEEEEEEEEFFNHYDETLCYQRSILNARILSYQRYIFTTGSLVDEDVFCR
jgi:hypothetical protein